jgi:hypothetical protein
MWDFLPADQLDPDDETRRLIAEKMAGAAKVVADADGDTGAARG